MIGYSLIGYDLAEYLKKEKTIARMEYEQDIEGVLGGFIVFDEYEDARQFKEDYEEFMGYPLVVCKVSYEKGVDFNGVVFVLSILIEEVLDEE